MPKHASNVLDRLGRGIYSPKSCVRNGRAEDKFSFLFGVDIRAVRLKEPSCGSVFKDSKTWLIKYGIVIKLGLICFAAPENC